MNSRRSPQEWQQLSDHLDGQLTAQESAQLEERLRADSALQVDLENLRVTRALLRRAPRRRRPRSFTLSPETAQQVKKQTQTLRSLFPVYSFASIAASFIFIILLLFKMLPVFSPVMRSVGAAAEENMLDAVPMQKEVMAEAEEPAMMEAPAAEAEMVEDATADIAAEPVEGTADEEFCDEYCEDMAQELAECDVCKPLHEAEESGVAPEIMAEEEAPAEEMIEEAVVETEEEPAPAAEPQNITSPDAPDAEKDYAAAPSATPGAVPTAELQATQGEPAVEAPRVPEELPPGEAEPLPEPTQWQEMPSPEAMLLETTAPAQEAERVLPPLSLSGIVLALSGLIALIAGLAAWRTWHRMRR